MRKFILLSGMLICFTLVATLLAGCNTGIESTRTIKMSRSEQRESHPGEEQTFINALRSEPLEAWKVGKSFFIADDRASVILEYAASEHNEAMDSGLAGRIVKYLGTISRNTPGGDAVTLIEFSDSTDVLVYNTGKTANDALSLTGLDIPMLIDMDLVADADTLLKGRTLWTRSRLWYDKEGKPFDGRKFVPVRIDGVSAGTMLFPLRVEFTDTTGRNASMLVNISSRNGIGAESRTFQSLFSMSDPKLKYHTVSPEFWELICDGRIASGMTKDECRLALGNPAETDSGHSWESLIDVWKYNDGTFLQFKDGLLIGFRK